MELTVSSDAGDSGDDLEELQEWLRQEPEFRGRVDLVEHQPKPGELGVISDVLSIALGGGGALSVLAASLRSFFAQPRRSDLRITVRRPDGGSVEISASRIDNVDALLRGVLGQEGDG